MRAEPVGVVDQERGVAGAREVEEALELRRMPATFAVDLLGESSVRSCALPLGSPIIPVPPPTRAMGVWPA